MLAWAESTNEEVEETIFRGSPGCTDRARMAPSLALDMLRRNITGKGAQSTPRGEYDG